MCARVCVDRRIDVRSTFAPSKFQRPHASRAPKRQRRGGGPVCICVVPVRAARSSTCRGTHHRSARFDFALPRHACGMCGAVQHASAMTGRHCNGAAWAGSFKCLSAAVQSVSCGGATIFAQFLPHGRRPHYRRFPVGASAGEPTSKRGHVHGGARACASGRGPVNIYTVHVATPRPTTRD